MYPFKRFYIKDINELYDKLEDYDFKIAVSSFYLSSYYPKYKLFLPPLFRNKPYHIEGNKVPTDDISDYFIEEIRLNVRHGNEKSPLELWEDKDIKNNIMNKVKDPNNLIELREACYNDKLTEASTFKPNWARTIIKFIFKDDEIEGKKWLDISAGWGDRLIAAMSLNMKYEGYDPNVDLSPHYLDIINTFKTKYNPKIYIQPFETSKITKKFDLVLTSPPFFDLEKYSNDENQSYIKYPTYEDWIIKFLFVSLKKAWDALSFEGYLILHLGDQKNKNLCEPTNLFINEYLSYSNYEGVIGLKGNSKYYRPIWVWKKTLSYKKLNFKSIEILYNNLYIKFFNTLIIKINDGNIDVENIELLVSKEEFIKWNNNKLNNKEIKKLIKKYNDKDLVITIKSLIF